MKSGEISRRSNEGQTCMSGTHFACPLRAHECLLTISGVGVILVLSWDTQDSRMQAVKSHRRT
jgi:hypothetical protein